MSNVKTVVNHVFKDRTPFAKAGACAIVIGVGDILVTVGGLLAIKGDLVWLMGDMAHALQPYHWTVYNHLIWAGIVTIIGLIVIGLSFVYLGVSLIMYSNKQERKHQMRLERKKYEEECHIPRAKHSEK